MAGEFIPRVPGDGLGPYDPAEEARRGSRSALAGHRPGAGPSGPSQARARPQPIPTAADVERLCLRQPSYRVDGTREMLLRWLEEGTYGQVRWFLAHSR
jgi:hypothetical protein